MHETENWNKKQWEHTENNKTADLNSIVSLITLKASDVFSLKKGIPWYNKSCKRKKKKKQMS